ncbi:hypothetical protein B0H12DRAFT_1246818 [Mycena haematopus]|nr:hypothetical protein B0H12DRAFT_1246818 [Mycena haematopus]
MPTEFPCEIEDIIFDLVGARHPESLESVLGLNKRTHAYVWNIFYRILCVGNDTRKAGATTELSNGLFPLLSMEKFLAAIKLSGHPVQRVQHLHMDGWTDKYGLIFAACPQLVTLWIEEHFGVGSFLDMKVMMGLNRLRELTIPALYAITEEHWVDVVLPTVTHLHFCTICPRLPLDDRVLDCFRNLTHLGFAAEPAISIIPRVVETRDQVGVLVRGPATPASIIHPRVVYLLHVILDSDRDWLKRAAPEWCAWDQAAWDQWTFFDAVMDARKRGKMQKGEITNVVWDHCNDFGLSKKL